VRSVSRALERCARKFYDISLETHSGEDILIVHSRHRQSDESADGAIGTNAFTYMTLTTRLRR